VREGLLLQFKDAGVFHFVSFGYGSWGSLRLGVGGVLGKSGSLWDIALYCFVDVLCPWIILRIFWSRGI
jgi:hypothetical protein